MKSAHEIFNNDIKEVIGRVDTNAFRNSRILLAGGSGLIGSSFAFLFHYLNTQLSYGIEVDLVTKRPLTPTSVIWLLRKSPGFRYEVRDLAAPIEYEKRYDFMIHAAGYGTPAVFLEDPVATIDVNYIGIKSILESTKKHNPAAKILYLSSSEIYGSPEEAHIPTPETFPGNSSVTNNRACYVESKRLSEVICLAYKHLFGLHVKIARPALSYGPGLTFTNGRVLSQFFKKAIEKKKIEMMDDGRDLRSFCYISDVLTELLLILLFGKETIYNVGSSEEAVSVRELAEKIGRLMGVEVIPGPGKDASVIGAPSRVCLDMSKMKNEFGFAPQVSLDEGLRRMLEWNLAFQDEKGNKSNE